MFWKKENIQDVEIFHRKFSQGRNSVWMRRFLLLPLTQDSSCCPSPSRKVPAASAYPMGFRMSFAALKLPWYSETTAFLPFSYFPLCHSVFVTEFGVTEFFASLWCYT